jgi:exodeoxyribonuclease-1
MATSFFFYDLETSGFNPKEARIMQFAGQRTDLELKPIGKPVNCLIRLTSDILPDPDAVLVTGITPQSTQTDGLTEHEFLELFETTVNRPDTIYVGYNNIRFDDEFMRFLHYRNFYDPYEWQWQAGRSRWDLLDVVRMTRALRPVGIKWPLASDGSPSNRLELLSSLNGLDHEHAHDALNDVGATIALARLIRSHQAKLFDYLLSIRNKKQVAELVLGGEPFIYTSGKYPGEYEKTSVVVLLAEHPKRPGALVYDLRYDPTNFSNLSPQALADVWRWQKEPVSPRLPVKTMRFNTCPAIAPLGVLDKPSQTRLKLNLKLLNEHYQQLKKVQADLVPKLLIALDIHDGEQQTSLSLNVPEIDGQLYEGFFTDKDKRLMANVRSASAEELQSQNFNFSDHRLNELLPLYRARNFGGNLTAAEHIEWEDYRAKKLLTGGDKSSLARYFGRLKDIAEQNELSDRDKYLLEELRLYGQSIMPAETADAS